MKGAEAKESSYTINMGDERLTGSIFNLVRLFFVSNFLTLLFYWGIQLSSSFPFIINNASEIGG